MTEKPDRSSAVVARATPPAAGATLQWDGRSDVCGDVESQMCSERVRRPAFQAKAPPAPAHRPCLSWTTAEIGRIPAVPLPAIAWEQEAARMTFSLPLVLLTATVQTMLPGATGELVWLPWAGQMVSPTPTVHPALLVYTPCASLQAARVTIVPALPAHDPLLHHMTLLLQAALAGEDVVGQMYAAALADALAAHFLRRYAAARPSLHPLTGGLTPSTLRRMTAYIQDHLEQTLSLATLAAVAQISPAHFARQFKQSTGWTPHQYVITCRIASAKRLLVETDIPLIAIGPQVGCADQSHFTALFRQHVAMTPHVYRNTARAE